MKRKPIYAESWAMDKLYKIRQSEPRLESLFQYFERRLSDLGIKNPQEFLRARLVYLLRVKSITHQWRYLETMAQYPDAWETVYTQVIVPSRDRHQGGLFEST